MRTIPSTMIPSTMTPSTMTPNAMQPCPSHGDLVLALAQGRLDDDESRGAESALRDCPACRAWWQTALDHPDVAQGVADGLAGFRPPAAQPASRPWPLRLAAALVLLAGGTAAWLAQGPAVQGPAVQGPAEEVAGAAPASVRRPSVIVAEGLESGSPSAAETIFADGLESGDLGSWRSRS